MEKTKKCCCKAKKAYPGAAEGIYENPVTAKEVAAATKELNDNPRNNDDKMP